VGFSVQTGLIFANLATLAHLSVSSAMSLPNSAGVIDFACCETQKFSAGKFHDISLKKMLAANADAVRAIDPE
jgi:hypothetical protein